MKPEFLSLIPKNSRTLRMLHDSNFRPDQAPLAQPVDQDRVIFEQAIEGLVGAGFVRAPICLLSEGDTALLREMGADEGLETVKFLTEKLPTAAVLLDAFRQINQPNSLVVWFSEEQLFAETVSRATGGELQEILPLFEAQSDQVFDLLARSVELRDQSSMRLIRVRVSDPEVTEAIKQAVLNSANDLSFNSKEKKSIKGSSAVVVASTHALFRSIMHLLFGQDKESMVQGPVHLETNPPHWEHIVALSTVARFIKDTAKAEFHPHRTLLPCLFLGEPIGEFSALATSGPQIRRDEREKLELFTDRDPFPLSQNPIFGHAIGMMENPEVEKNINQMLFAEKNQDEEIGRRCQINISQIMDQFLTDINFWQ